MFSLIITLVSIALVAALALATMYYGGKSLQVGSAKATAAKILVQSQQLQGAAEVYKADRGVYPASMDELVTNGYLHTIPVAQADMDPRLENPYQQASFSTFSPSARHVGSGMLQTAYTPPEQPAGTSSPWVMLVANHPVFVIAPVTEDVCKSINQQSYGQSGILKTLRSTWNSQCYGSDLSNLVIVSSSSGTELVTVANDPSIPGVLGTVSPAPVPTDTADGDWLVAPGTTPVVAPPTSTGALVATDNAGQVITSLAFPDTPVGIVSNERVVQFKNTSTAPIELTTTTSTAPFGISYEDCSGAVLAPDQSCTVYLLFPPTVVQTYTGTGTSLEVVTSGGAHVSLPLIGNGLVSAPFLSIETRGFYYLPNEPSAPSGYGWQPHTGGGMDPAFTENWMVVGAYDGAAWGINDAGFPQRVFIIFPTPNPSIVVTSASFQYQGRAQYPVPLGAVLCESWGCAIDSNVFTLSGTGAHPATLTVSVGYSTSNSSGLSVSTSFSLHLANAWF
jgi:hypothetical protein